MKKEIKLSIRGKAQAACKDLKEKAVPIKVLMAVKK